ncbi:MAG: hypothetical protein ABIQ64_03870 [Candidatus Saccharimonadales bacterium]
MTTKTTTFKAGLVIALLGFSLFAFAPAGAIEGESIVLSPASIRLKADSGQTVKDTFKVINDGTQAYDFVVYASPYSVANRTYTPNYDQKKPDADLYTWVSFEKDVYTLNPGETVDIPYTIAVPADAAPGGHYSVLFAETQVNGDQSSQIARKKRVGAIVYATVAGDYITAGKQLSTNIDWLQLGGPIVATVFVENTGNVDFTMTESILIKNIVGAKVYQETNEKVMLPKTTRDLELSWKNGPLMGLYNVTVETKILDKVTSTNTWVLLMPMWILVVSILAIGGLIYWVVRSRRPR